MGGAALAGSGREAHGLVCGGPAASPSSPRPHGGTPHPGQPSPGRDAQAFLGRLPMRAGRPGSGEGPHTPGRGVPATGLEDTGKPAASPGWKKGSVPRKKGVCWGFGRTLLNPDCPEALRGTSVPPGGRAKRSCERRRSLARAEWAQGSGRNTLSVTQAAKLGGGGGLAPWVSPKAPNRPHVRGSEKTAGPWFIDPFREKQIKI